MNKLIVTEGLPSCYLHDQMLQAKDYVTALSSIQSPNSFGGETRKDQHSVGGSA
jgi:hypothetical protein